MHRSNGLIDGASRLKQFSWEQWDDQVIAVIFRPGHYGLDRYVVKRYVEQVLFQSQRWKQLSPYFSNITPFVRAYAITSYEVELMRRILDYHLSNRLHLRITPSNDQLIEYEALLDFIGRIQELSKSNCNGYNNIHPINGKNLLVPVIPSISSSYILPSSTKLITSPLPQLTALKTSPVESLPILTPSQSNQTQGSTTITNGHHISQSKINSSSTVQNKSNNASHQFSLSILPELCPISLQNARIDGNGWVQINNVYVPFIIKNRQRLAPYEILVSCKILEPNELRSTLTCATRTDISLINSMILDCKINSEKLPENATLINVYHVLIGTKNLVYIKILSKDNPTTKVNRRFKNVISLQGGTLYINTRLVPYVCSNDHIYIPLNDILTIYPNLHIQLKSFARAPRHNELDYLQLVQMYYDEKELPLDTLLIDMENVNKTQVISSKTMTLIEHHAKEKTKLEQQIALLNKSSLITKRKNSQPHENQQRFKASTSSPLPSSVNQPNSWLLSNTGHRGRTRWQ